MIRIDTKSFAINFPLPIYQISRNVHHVENLINRIVPLLQNIVLMLHGLEVYDIVESINAAAYNLIVIQDA